MNMPEKTEKTLEERIYGKLADIGLKMRRESRSYSGYYDVEYLVSEIALELASAARQGQLTKEQYRQFGGQSRTELEYRFFEEVGDALGQNRKKYGGYTGLTNRDTIDDDLEMDANVRRLTKAQIFDKYGIEEKQRSPEVTSYDVSYGCFLRENGLTGQKGAEITEKDLWKPRK